MPDSVNSPKRPRSVKVKISTKERGHIVLDDVEWMEIDGVHFSSAASIVGIFAHPDRIVRLSLRGEPGQMSPWFEILSAAPSPANVIHDVDDVDEYGLFTSRSV